MLLDDDMIYLSKQAKHKVKKVLLWDEHRNKNESRARFLYFYVNM